MFNSGTMIGAFRGPWGVRVELDQSLLFLLGLLVYLSVGAGLAQGLIFAAVLIGSIFLHELGHAWGCVVQGVPVARVVLHGGGGFCQHAPAPNARSDELIVLMGPLVNLALWALAGIGQWALFSWAEGNPGWVLGNFALFQQAASVLALIGWVNMALFLFNLLPVQPLDGGRLFHHLMLRFMPAPAAQRVTGAVGLVAAILWIPAAIWAFLNYGFILFFFPSIPAHYRMMRGGLGI